MKQIIVDFLRESNAIEDVFDDDSLKQAEFAWNYLRLKKELDVYDVMKAHKILMLHQKLQPNEKGYLRKVQVWVGGREGLPWHVLPEAMEVWCMNAWLFPEHWQAHHVRFEVIHPFVDGNGRLGRILMNWQRLKAKLPILVIKADERKEYYQWFLEGAEYGMV
jgi:Fic family protein